MPTLKELRDKATQGEWGSSELADGMYLEAEVPVKGEVVGDYLTIAQMCDKLYDRPEANAEYIAALHNANLIDRLERYEKTLEIAKESLGVYARLEAFKRVEGCEDSHLANRTLIKIGQAMEGER